MVKSLRRGTRLNLALQGGGAHGAFTWGVLDRLLEEQRLEFTCVSGTSAGAINAVAMAAGFIEDGRTGAKQRLAAVWGAIESAGVPEFMRGVARMSMAQIMSVFSPYDFNPLNFDPLRKLLDQHIDFERIRAAAPFELLIAATEAASGRARLFRSKEMTVEAVLASACLPSLHRAVEIGGVHYWDGGFSANPDLVTLAGGGFAGDTLLVQLMPVRRDEVPTRARDIAGQVNLITFNQPLMRDVAMIAEIKSRGRLALWGAAPERKRIARHRFHLIEAAPHTAHLSHETMGEPDAGLLTYLRDAGRQEAEQWLEAHARQIGRRSSTDLVAKFALNSKARAALKSLAAPHPAS